MKSPYSPQRLGTADIVDGTEVAVWFVMVGEAVMVDWPLREEVLDKVEKVLDASDMGTDEV